MKNTVIKNFPNYIIYEDGRIVNRKTKKIKNISICNKGYKMISLWKNNKASKIRIHRLLAESFIFNKYNLETVNHIDGNKLNNDLNNLEWMSYSDNNIHAFKTGLRKQQMILTYDDIYNILISEDTNYNLSKKYNVSSSHISSMRRGSFIESFKLHSGLFEEKMIKPRRITGVTKTKSNKFLATITLPNHRNKSVGCFVSKDEAIIARNNYIDNNITLSRKNTIKT